MAELTMPVKVIRTLEACRTVRPGGSGVLVHPIETLYWMKSWRETDPNPMRLEEAVLLQSLISVCVCVGVRERERERERVRGREREIGARENK